MAASIIDATLDAASVSLALYIVVVGIGRLAMMSWQTHRKIWQAIYFLLVVAAALYLKAMAEGEATHAPVPILLIMLATAAWFYESKDRWLIRAPDYLAIDCPRSKPDRPQP